MWAGARNGWGSARPGDPQLRRPAATASLRVREVSLAIASARLCRSSGRSMVVRTSSSYASMHHDEPRPMIRPRGLSRHGSGPRGSPSMRPAAMVLLTSVVPPSIMFARLRSIPTSSQGSSAAYRSASTTAGGSWSLSRSPPPRGTRTREVASQQLDVLAQRPLACLADQALGARCASCLQPGAPQMLGPALDALFGQSSGPSR